MAGLNKVMLIGNLTRDPELRYTPSGTAVAEFGLAMNRVYRGQDGNKQEETTFVDITVWARQAETANQYLSKGRRVFVEGRLKFDSWTSPEGQRRSKLSVVAENLQFLDSRGEGSPGGHQQGQQGPPQQHYGGSEGNFDQAPQQGGGFDGPPEPGGDDNIPF